MNKELDPILDRVNMTKQEFQSYLKNYRKAGYEEGWSECMKLWADHMTRMNTALAATKEVPWKADSQAAPKAVPLTEVQRMDIVTNWFTDEADITRALQMLTDFEQTSNIGSKP